MPALDRRAMHPPRRTLRWLGLFLCVGRARTLLTARPWSCRGPHRRQGVSWSPAQSRPPRRAVQRSGRCTAPFPRPLQATGDATAPEAYAGEEFGGDLDEDEFEEDPDADEMDGELEEEDFSAALVKGSGEIKYDIGADEYFGRYISAAMTEEMTTHNKKRKTDADAENAHRDMLDDTRHMLKQQQKQIDLLTELVQGRQQAPPPPADAALPLSAATTAAPPQSAPARGAPPPSAGTVAPLKAMLFIDGTWLYYSLQGHNSGRDAVTDKFGAGWQNDYKVDWLALPRLICDQIEQQQRNSKTTFSGSERPLEIARVLVFTSAKVETDPNSRRMRMFRAMANANYDVHMMQTVGQGEKCVDIQLAVEMLHYSTVPHALDVAILLSGDKDFVPALVRTRQKGKQVCVSSMRRGCNRVLYESPHIRDYDVVWLENCLDELIVPISPEERSRRDRAGMASAFTMMRVVRDFVMAAPDHEWVSSRDIGKYLKSVEIADSNMLDELKAGQGGLRQFLMERACNLFDVKFPESGAIPGRGEFSFWVRVKGDSDGHDTLMSEFTRTQFFTKEEKEFLEEYTKEHLTSKWIKDDSYQHTTMAANYFDAGNGIVELEEDSDLDLDGSASPALDYSQLTVITLKDICREKGLPVSGAKSVLIDRLELDRKMEFEVREKQRREKREASVKSQRGTKKSPRRWTSTISRGTGARSMSSAADSLHTGNIYSQALPQMDAASTARHRSPRVGNAPADPAATARLEALVKEYLTASGGVAGSRDVGRYLAANGGSRQGYRSALAELKDTHGSLSAFILSREDVFSMPASGGQNDFPVKLVRPGI